MTALAHPAERELARLFDEHGIRWEYEPHTFVLARDRDGIVREAFTPDFFLPELDLYLECTVMRQPYTRNKRRKARQVAERTGATVEIIFRRDFERLARRWNLPQLAPSDDDHVWAAPAVGTERHLGDARGIGFDRLFRVGEARLPDGAVVVEVEGDVDLHSAPELRDRLNALIGDGAERVVVDLSEATFLDSMALGVLLGAKREVADRDGMLELVVATDDIRRIFEITMLERIFRIHPTRAEALGADGSS